MKGFTLIELLIVVAIFSIIATIGFGTWQEYRFEDQCHEAGGVVERIYSPALDDYRQHCVFTQGE